MGVLEKFCNAASVFSLLSPLLTHCENLDASYDDGFSGFFFGCLNKMNDNGYNKSCRYMTSITMISPVIKFN